MPSYLGKHLKVFRGAYWHHGIGDGKGGVVHYGGKSGISIVSAPITRISLRRFRLGAAIHVVEYCKSLFPPEEILRRAESRIGEDSYSVWQNNCEHFATWCVMDSNHSEQASSLKLHIGAVGWGLLLGGPVGAVTALATIKAVDFFTNEN